MTKLFGSYSKRNRKASMQLSINAIVILVLAMAVLGLGLGIVKGIKNKANTFLDFDVDLDEAASASTHVTNLGDDVTWKAGKPNDLGIGFYSTSSDCETNGAWIYIDCGDFAITDGDSSTTLSSSDAFSYTQRPTKIGDGESGKLLAKIEPDKIIPRDSYACSFQIYCFKNDDGEFIPGDNKPVEELPIFVNIVS